MSTENKWITPTLVDIESLPASDLTIEKPHFGAKHQPTVKQSAALGRLFSTVHSSTDTQSIIDTRRYYISCISRQFRLCGILLQSLVCRGTI